MKHLYTILLAFMITCSSAWGQAGRLHRLASVEGVLAYNSSTVYDSLDQVSYNGSIYRLDTLSSFGSRPDLFSFWSKVTVDNPASITYVDANSFKRKLQNNTSSISIFTDSIVKYDDYTIVITNDTVNEITQVIIPDPTSTINGKKVTVVDSSLFNTSTYLQNANGFIRYKGEIVSRVYLNNNTVAQLTYLDSLIAVETKDPTTILSFVDDFNKRFNEGTKVDFLGSSYKLQKARPANVDGSIVREVLEIAPNGQNLLSRSENFSHASNTVGWSLSSSIRSTVIDTLISPDNTKTADVITRTSTGSGRITKYLYLDSINVQFQAGDIVNFSCWMKLPQSSVNNSAFIDEIEIQERQLSPNGFTVITDPSVPSAIYLDTISKEWTRVSAKMVVNQSTTADTNHVALFVVDFNSEVGDSIALWGAQLEVNKAPSKYKKTGNLVTDIILGNDMSYAVLQIENGILNLRNAYRSSNVDDNIVIQNAFDYCEETGLCNLVAPWDGSILKDTLLIPAKMGLIGLGPTTIFIDLNDSTKTAIYCRRDAAYTRDQSFKNISFEPLSAAYAYIGGNNSYRQRYEDLIMTGERQSDNLKLVKYGVIIGADDGDKALDSEIDDCQITDFLVSPIKIYRAGNGHTIRNTVALRSSVGIDLDVSSALILRCQIETNDTAIVATGGDVYVNENTYIEDGTINLTNLQQFEYKNSRISGGSFNAYNVEAIILDNNRLGFGARILHQSGVKPIITVVKNQFERNTDLDAMLGYWGDSPESTIKDNRLDSKKITLSSIGKTLTFNSEIKSSVLSGITSIGDTLRFSNNYITGLQQNLLAYSDSIMVADEITADHEIQNNVVLAPDGTMTADLMIGLSTTPTTTSLNNHKSLATIQVGEKTIVSFWAKDLKEDGYSDLTILFRYGTGNDDVGPFYNKNWTRYQVVIDSAEANTANLSKRRQFISEGDSVAFWGWQLNYGNKMLPFVRTTSFGINSNDVASTISDPDNRWDITGGIETNHGKIDSLYDSDGDLPTTGQNLAGKAGGVTDWITPYTAGNASPTTDLSGILTITHGLGTTPSAAYVTNETGNSYIFDVSRGATNLTVTVYDETGAIVPSTAVALSWAAFR